MTELGAPSTSSLTDEYDADHNYRDDDEDDTTMMMLDALKMTELRAPT